MHILGINSVYHESAACLIHEGRIVAAAEEERFNRRKHGKEARADNPDELPLEAIRFCLRAGGVDWGDVAHVGCAGDPAEMERVRRAGLPSAWSSVEKQDLFLASLPRVPRRVAELGFRGRFHWVPHHAAHAASTYFVSPFPEAAVLVVDALGDDAFSTGFFHGKGNRLTCLGHVAFPASLGYLWELISLFLGFGVYDAAKVMGLAAYGDPEAYREVFERLAWRCPGGVFGTADDLLHFSAISYYPPSGDYEALERLFGVRRREPGEELRSEHQNIAAALQCCTDAIVRHMADHLRAMTGSRRLCLAGGVALNCVTNREVFESGPWEELHVQAAAHDGGTALGAACYVWNECLGRPERGEMTHAYLGPEFAEAEIEAALRAEGWRYDRPDDPESTVAALVAAREVVGFFQGAMEFGPRALGHRSILADPRCRDMRELLNRKVKHREYFRPLAPSVLAEEAERWFEIRKPTTATDYMLMAYPARAEVRDRIPAVLHVDGTSRVQTVRREASPRFHRVIREFEKLTGVPMVLNTSFNDQEPIVCSPRDALRTLRETEIDVLALGPFLVRKRAG